jgi:hypothetical protein
MAFPKLEAMRSPGKPYNLGDNLLSDFLKDTAQIEAFTLGMKL